MLIPSNKFRGLALFASLPLLAACGEKTIPLYPVSGQVVYQGKPAANAQVVFHDKRPAKEIHDIPIPRARTDSEGKFQLSSYKPDDGAPAGEYTVTVMLSSVTPAQLASSAKGESPNGPSAPENSSDTVDPEAAGVTLVVEGKKYIDPQTSGLEAVVREQENALPPFELD